MRTKVIGLAVTLVVLMLAGAGSNVRAEVVPQARRIDWSPGVPGGIPTRSTVFYTDTGALDSVATINAQLANCTPGQVVQLQAGTYALSSEITITKGCTLRGAGPASTILTCTAAWHCIQLGDFPSAPSTINVTGSPAKGATSISVASASGLSVGDYVVIDETNDGVEVVNNNTAFGSAECRSGGGTRCLGQIVRITAISGTTLTIDAPLNHAYAAAQTPQIWKLSSVTTGAGVEDLTVTRTTNNGGQYNNFKIVACSGCWLKNVVSNTPDAWHVDLDRSISSEVRDSSFLGGQSNASGRAYGVVSGVFATANLIENNIFYRNRHSMVLQNGSTGNVYGYNYSIECFQGDPAEAWLATDMNTHGAHPTMNLFEGNIGCKVYGDDAHGSSSYNTVFRNHVTRESNYPGINQARRAVDIEQYNTGWNIVGNVLGQPSQSWTAYDPGTSRSASAGQYVYTFGYFSDGQSTSADYAGVSGSTYRHGNFDYQSNSTIWDSSNADHALPASLYRTSKPAFFGNLPWPAIGPDASPMAGTIPAKERYNGNPVGASVRPNPPTNLVVN
jgi:hypothetical protein